MSNKGMLVVSMEKKKAITSTKLLSILYEFCRFLSIDKYR